MSLIGDIYADYEAKKGLYAMTSPTFVNNPKRPARNGGHKAPSYGKVRKGEGLALAGKKGYRHKVGRLGDSNFLDRQKRSG